MVDPRRRLGAPGRRVALNGRRPAGRQCAKTRDLTRLRARARVAAQIAVALVCAWPLGAAAQGQDGSAPAGLEPPEPVSRTAIAAPTGAAQTGDVVVRVKIIVRADGSVRSVERLEAPNPPWDDAVMAAVAGWTFRPGRYQGKPVVVAITFSHTFVAAPPTPVAADDGPPRPCRLLGRVVEKGTRAPAQGLSIVVEAERGGDKVRADVDRGGRFGLPVPCGALRVGLHGVGYLPFVQRESLGPLQQLRVGYLVERERYDPYEIVVFGKQQRQELSRLTLRGPEIRQVPGTFGDPFRVVTTLPGVASVMSLLPLPVVRGASPGSTGLLIDGTRVPMLFHLLGGPSVIHPEFIDEIRFYPGGAPVLYGGYTAGIVDGRTRRAGADERRVDIDLNLLQAGALVRTPIPLLGATLTAAGRIGYPGLILSLATAEASLSYLDYQLRLDGGSGRNGWTVFAFGATDELLGRAADADPADPTPELEPVLQLGFHRLDLRGQVSSGALSGQARLVSGFDTSLGVGSTLTKWVVEPTLRAEWQARPELTLVAGVEGLFHHTDVEEAVKARVGGGGSSGGDGGGGSNVEVDPLTEGLRQISGVAALGEALWRPVPRLLLRPGVRVDGRSDGTTSRFTADPRLSARFRLGRLPLPWLAPATPKPAPNVSTPADVTPSAAAPAADPDEDGPETSALKAGIGLYHQPPRMFLPLPGLDMLPLRYGMLRAIQTSVGGEFGLGEGFSASAETFFNWMDPVIFDLSFNRDSVVTEAQGALLNAAPAGGKTNAQRFLDRLVQGQRGRAMGLELLVRRQSRAGPYGWISYTLSLSERERTEGWAPYDFDRTHLLNAVVGLQLPRNWDLGLRLAWQSGKPATTTAGYNTARDAGYVRLDLRVDKRAVWRRWLLDFYIDLANFALLPEEVTPGAQLRYVLPTVGFRARL